MQHMMHGPVSAHMGIPSRHKTASAGCTDGILAKGGGKRDRIFLYQSIKVRCFGGRISDMSQNVSAPLVGIKNYDVRLPSHSMFLLFLPASTCSSSRRVFQADHSFQAQLPRRQNSFMPMKIQTVHNAGKR
jgi:hypothetical protein